MEVLNGILGRIADAAVPFLGKLVFAIVVWIAGKYIIRKVLKLLEKGIKFNALEDTVKDFVRSFVKFSLYTVLIVSIVGILGVETSSIIAVLASAGVAIGLALQGSLSNLAGGMMILIFKPFKEGDYIEAAGSSGTVTEVAIFYTTLITPDNKRITVPNGSLMNANVVNYSSEKLRRVDLAFSCAKSESPERVKKVILDAIAKCDNILSEPAPFAEVSGGTNEAMSFDVRVWVNNSDYWTVYYDVINKVTAAFGESEIAAPAVRFTAEN